MNVLSDQGDKDFFRIRRIVREIWSDVIHLQGDKVGPWKLFYIGIKF